MDLSKAVENRIALEKRIFSYLKSKWGFNDYPIKTWKNPYSRDRNLSYLAAIINWPLMVGHGETREQAIETLKEKFQTYRDNNQRLPRPGTRVPVQIRFASTEQIIKYVDIEEDFFKRVLKDFIKRILFISDASSLSGYEPRDTEQAKKQRGEIIRRTLSIYGVDITDLYDGPLYKIFELIRNKMDKAGTQE